MDIKSFFRENIAPNTETTRNKWVISKLSKIPPKKSILDIGAGTMPFKKYCGHLKYKSQDFGKYTGLNVKKGLQTGKFDTKGVDIISDITSIPVKSNSFDYVLCTEVFEHIPDPMATLKEINRVTKKGGSVILSAPFASMTHFHPYFFYSGFSDEFYKVNLPRFGYRITEIVIYGNYFDYLALEFVRTPYIVFGYNKVLSLIILPFVFLALPWWTFLRILSNLFPKSKELLAFGLCVSAKKVWQVY